MLIFSVSRPFQSFSGMHLLAKEEAASAPLSAEMHSWWTEDASIPPGGICTQSSSPPSKCKLFLEKLSLVYFCSLNLMLKGRNGKCKENLLSFSNVLENA